jgi:hypothetical protein
MSRGKIFYPASPHQISIYHPTKFLFTTLSIYHKADFIAFSPVSINLLHRSGISLILSLISSIVRDIFDVLMIGVNKNLMGYKKFYPWTLTRVTYCGG